MKLLTLNPARLLKLGSEFGTIYQGNQANLTLVDVNQEWVVSKKDFASKSRNCCFLGKKLKGKVRATICAGKLWRFE